MHIIFLCIFTQIYILLNYYFWIINQDGRHFFIAWTISMKFSCRMLCISVTQNHEVYLCYPPRKSNVEMSSYYTTFCDSSITASFHNSPSHLKRTQEPFQPPFSITHSSLTYADSDTNAGIDAVTNVDDQSPPVPHCICKLEIYKIRLVPLVIC